MKKLMYFTLVGTVISFFGGNLAAQEITGDNSVSKPAVSDNNNANFKGGLYADENKNGICDRFENRNSNQRGSKFKDANNNDICDRFENGSGLGNGKGKGGQYRNRTGLGNGNNGCNGSGKGFKHRNCRRGLPN